MTHRDSPAGPRSGPEGGRTAPPLLSRERHPAVLEEQARRVANLQLRIADWITACAGSMQFVYFHIALFAVWMVFLESRPWPTLTLIVSLEAIFLSTFILISQNRDAQLSKRRSQLDLQINLLTEQENTKMLTMLKQIADKVGADVSHDPTVQVLAQSTQPEKLVEQIERTIETAEQGSALTP